MVRPVIVCTVLTLFACTLSAAAQARYYPIQIPTRDGRTLAADLYASDTSVAKPTILVQTPYNKNYYRLAVNIPAEAGGSPFPYDSVHYNVVVVDWRGFFGSKDANVNGYDRGLDGYDAVEWIAARPWCNGKVGTWGPSALGQIQFLTAKQHPPHLVCSVPLVKDFKTKYSDFYCGGVYRQEHVESLEKLGLGSTALILSHPTNDLTWSVVEKNNDYPDSINVPMLLITGWFDHFPEDVIRAYKDLRARGGVYARDRHKLIIGPWTHSGIGKLKQGILEFPDAVGFADSMTLMFFDYYLRDINNGYLHAGPIWYYLMGIPPGVPATTWNTADIWPPGASVQAKGLWPERYPMTDENKFNGVRDTIRFDPRDPSPTFGGARLAPFTSPPPAEGPQDQREVVESRGDIQSYFITTEVPGVTTEFLGPIGVTLYVSSDRTDSDIGVRLCDVYPDGRSVLLTQTIRRLRFRNGLRPQDTAAMQPGIPEPVTIELQNIATMVGPGHRLRIDVTSSNFPMYAINPNTGGPLYAPGDSLVATNVLHFGGAMQSRITMRVRYVQAAVDGAPGDTHDADMLRLIGQGAIVERARMAVVLPTAGHAVLEIVNMRGERVAVPLDARLEAGPHEVTWAPARGLPAGLYLARLRAGARTATQRLLLVR